MDFRKIYNYLIVSNEILCWHERDACARIGCFIKIYVFLIYFFITNKVFNQLQPTRHTILFIHIFLVFIPKYGRLKTFF